MFSQHSKRLFWTTPHFGFHFWWYFLHAASGMPVTFDEPLKADPSTTREPRSLGFCHELGLYRAAYGRYPQYGFLSAV